MNNNIQLNNRLWWLFHEYAEIGKRCPSDYVNVSKITDVEKMLDCLEIHFFTPYTPVDYQKNVIALEKVVRTLDNSSLKFFLQALVDIFKDKHRFCETNTDRHLNEAESSGLPIRVERPILNIAESVNSLLIKYGAPYRIENDIVVSVANEEMYNDVISVAFNLLDGLEWKAANQHYQLIHEEFAKDNFEGVVFLCGKCLEDVMKICCRKLGIADAETLSGCAVRDKLFRATEFGELPKKTKEKIMHDIELILTLRNEEGAHGSSVPHHVEKYLAEYQIHATSSVILLLVKLLPN